MLQNNPKYLQISNLKQELYDLIFTNYNVLSDTPRPIIIWADTWGILIKNSLIQWSLVAIDCFLTLSQIH